MTQLIPPESLLVGGPIQDNLEKVKTANPIPYISKEVSIPPFLIMHGEEDPLVPYNQSELLYNALRIFEHDAIMYKIKGAGHGSDHFWQKEVTDIVQQFFDQHLKKQIEE